MHNGSALESTFLDQLVLGGSKHALDVMTSITQDETVSLGALASATAEGLDLKALYDGNRELARSPVGVVEKGLEDTRC